MSNTEFSLIIKGSSQYCSDLKKELQCHFIDIKDEFTHLEENQRTLLVSFNDKWDTESDLQFQSLAKEKGLPYLRIYTDLDYLVVGPMTIPNNKGCIACFETRSYEASKKKIYYNKLSKVELISKNKTFYPQFTLVSNITVSILKELKLLNQGSMPVTKNAVYFINVQTMKFEISSFVHDVYCAYCSDIPDDEPETMTYEFKENLKPSPQHERVYNDKLSIDKLRKMLVDKRSGIVTSTQAHECRVIPIASAENSRHFDDESNYSLGREVTFNQAEKISLLESLERQAGSYPQRRKTVVFHPYSELNTLAIDPYSLGLYSDEHYDTPNFPFSKFDPDHPISWVWGYSYKNNTPILIPEQAAYFSKVKSMEQERRFIGDSSNGCALGSSFEEACLYGLFEVLERDAFLLMWHARLPVKSINLETINDMEIMFLKEKLEISDYRLFIFDIKTDFNLPCFTAFAVNKKNVAPRFFVSAACHKNPKKAIKNAIMEVISHSEIANTQLEENSDRIKELYQNPEKITSIQDHYLYYYHPGNFHLVDFLFNRDIPLLDFYDVFHDYYETQRSIDLTKELRSIIQVVIDKGYDVIAVNQTPDFYENCNLHSVKIIIPGTLPLGFGYHSSRVHNLNRLYEVNKLMGYSNSTLSNSQINPSPHPFP